MGIQPQNLIIKDNLLISTQLNALVNLSNIQESRIFTTQNYFKEDHNWHFGISVLSFLDGSTTLLTIYDTTKLY